MSIKDIITFLETIIWSKYLVGLCLLTGIYFSFRMKFPQVRLFKDMIRLLTKGETSETGVTPFQAFATSVGGRVGVGNIGGVAVAIALGGPGSIFWMWIIAFLGAASAFIESALAQAYKVKEGNVYIGGPAYFIEKGIGAKWYGISFAIVTILAPGILMPGAQTYTIASSIQEAFGINVYITGVILAVLIAVVIFGGVKRIGKTAEIIAPFMAAGYVIMAIIIIGTNITRVPQAFALIFKSAFGKEPLFSAILGSAIAWGVKRGVYSNEAGQGSGAIVSAAAEASHPAKQGLVQAFSVYIDTLLVCTATALMVILTNSYNVLDGSGNFIVENLPGIEYGVLYTQYAVDTLFSGFGSKFVAIAIFLFAYTSLLAYYYQAESNMSYLFPKNKTAIFIMRIIFILSSFSGVLNTSNLIWTCGDLGVGLMAWLNIVAILILSKQGIMLLKDYEKQKSQGIDPVFDPKLLNIKDSIWEEKYNSINKTI
ncbi:alanine:cation symporter family protein [Tissierella carlieri]|uniref:Alanine:cation symporter family protein n=1 Tax=Tissierella carlieri TaxID=689904 RepID=A0ABT1SAB7_9FIRM|nr:alanine/glycine:cation symporter family protein [Tissierella carlieri]MBU5312880.1 alanine:cation symporter family protein [Tissierella carlieri]MCQ4923428.1 alanine:cation symporter family protein [Tissierella carlieri]